MAYIKLLFYQVNEAMQPGASSSTDTGEVGRARERACAHACSGRGIGSLQ